MKQIMKNERLQDYVPRRTSLPPGQVGERHAGRSMLAMAMLLLLMWCVPQRAMADDFEASWVSVNFNNLQSQGYVAVTVPLRDNNGEYEWAKTSYIYVNDQEAVNFYNSNDQSDSEDAKGYFKTVSAAYAEVVNSSGKLVGLNSNGHTGVSLSKSGTTTKGEVRIYPTVDALKSGNISVKVHVEYVSEGVAKDGEFTTGLVTQSYTLPTAPSMNWNYSSNPGYQVVNFSGTEGDKYKITGSNIETEIKSTGTVSVDYTVQNTERTVSMTYYKKVSPYQYIDVEATDIIVPAYQHPTDLKATQLADGDVKVTWSIPTYNGEVVTGGDFEV